MYIIYALLYSQFVERIQEGKEAQMRYGRRAFGSHRVMTPAVRARNVAMSIHERGLDVNDAATWDRYGLTGNVAQQEMVRLALAGRK
jgi:hypothetical protein